MVQDFLHQPHARDVDAECAAVCSGWSELRISRAVTTQEAQRLFERFTNAQGAGGIAADGYDVESTLSSTCTCSTRIQTQPAKPNQTQNIQTNAKALPKFVTAKRSIHPFIHKKDTQIESYLCQKILHTRTNIDTRY